MTFSAVPFSVLNHFAILTVDHCQCLASVCTKITQEEAPAFIQLVELDCGCEHWSTAEPWTDALHPT